MKLAQCFALIFIVFALAACSHAPKHKAQEFVDLQEQLKVTIVNKLVTRADVKGTPEVKILSAEEANGMAKIRYQVTYTSNTQQSGTVLNTVEAEMDLIRTGERSWNVAKIHPKAQAVVFEDATEIVGRRKK